jgi:nitroimidazol reductase NimA-like FMN-containing flavoprotein (pyridoxamine 5'-phosphate oxidase superfamily)
VKRLPRRAHYDRDTVYAILDAGFACHLGYVIDGQPYVTPTAYWREGDSVYWHGSSKSRMLLALEKHPQICLTVSHFDGLVVARSGFHMSVNYRTAMIFGEPYKVEDPADKLAKMERFVERVYPGHWISAQAAAASTWAHPRCARPASARSFVISATTSSTTATFIAKSPRPMRFRMPSSSTCR